MRSIFCEHFMNCVNVKSKNEKLLKMILQVHEVVHEKLTGLCHQISRYKTCSFGKKPCLISLSLSLSLHSPQNVHDFAHLETEIISLRQSLFPLNSLPLAPRRATRPRLQTDRHQHGKLRFPKQRKCLMELLPILFVLS